MNREPPRPRFVPPPPDRSEIRLPEPEMACWPDPEYASRWRTEERRRQRGFAYLIGAGFVAAGFVAWLVLL